MAVNLVKGEKLNLEKEVGTLTKVKIALGWDASTNGTSIDCDSFALALKSTKHVLFKKKSEPKLVNNSDIVYYGNKTHRSGCIIHHGDNLTGYGDGDDEIISVDLGKMPEDIEEIIIGINIYNCRSKGQHFGMIKNCYVRIIGDNSRKEICRYNLTDDYSDYTALYVGKLVKENDEWHFKAVGEGTKDTSIEKFAKKFD